MFRFLLVSLCLLAAAASGFQFKARATEDWSKHALKLTTEAEQTRLWFALAEGLRILVTAAGDSGGPVTTTIAQSGPVDIAGAGKFTLTVLRDSGSGDWSCRDMIGSPALTGVASFADTTFVSSFSVSTEEDEMKWKFTYPPKDATFVVRTVAGKAVEEQDLDYSSEVELVGGGAFTVEVAPSYGGGEYTATLAE